MHPKALWGLAGILCLAGYPEVAVYAGKTVTGSANFSKQISKDDRVVQVLNRLTFGLRPGDVEQVRTMGLKKWIDLQLHPDRIPENPALAEKLKTFDTLTMTSEELVRNYPGPQVVRQMVAGQVPFPTDPVRRMMIQREVARAQQRQAAGAASAPPNAPNAPDTAPAACTVPRWPARARHPIRFHRRGTG